MKKITLKEIDRRLLETHKGTVSIIHKSYQGVAEKATFIDKKYGEWDARPHKVCKGQQHPKRKAYNKTVPIDEVRRRVYERHGDLLSIDESTYKTSGKKAKFIDKDFGEWWTIPSQVMLGVGHSQRSYDSHRLTIEEIRQRIFKKHGKTVILAESTYKAVDARATFIDKEYGEWDALPTNVFLGYGHPKRKGQKRIIKIEDVKRRLREKHGDLISIDESTYVKFTQKAKFIDRDFGEWWQYPGRVISKGSCHPLRSKINKAATNMARYGCVNPAQNKEISLKIARKLQNTSIRFHWKTGEELVCQAGWEPKIVDYLNINKIEFLWQSKTFTLPNGKTYRPDMFLIKEDLWIEIKGYMRPHSKIKWEWFHLKYPNSEIWGEQKLKELNIKIRS